MGSAVASAHSASTTLKFTAVQKATHSFSAAAEGIFKTGVITNGKVTGGTGAFKGATGTIAVKTISNTKHAVTITYSG